MRTQVVEMLITVLIMSFASMAIFGLLITTMSTSKRLNNKLDSIDCIRNAVDKIGRDVRMARNLGDVYGNNVNPDPVNHPENNAVAGCQSFPGAANPLYGSGRVPPEGGAGRSEGWPWGLNNFDMNAQEHRNRLLIVQVPIFDANGFPTVIPQGVGSPAATRAQENVETHIYRIIPDPNPDNAGEFVMQWVKIPGMVQGSVGASPALVTGISPTEPQTILTGIVGPLDDNGNPKIFQFTRKGGNTPDDTIVSPATIAADYQGVVLNLEIRQHNNTSRINYTYKTPGVMAIKQDIFIRNNAAATTVGMPSSVLF